MTKYNTNSPRTIAMTVVFGAASVLAVVLRFVARSKNKAQFTADDWLALASAITFLIWIIPYVYCMLDTEQGVLFSTEDMLRC